MICNIFSIFYCPQMSSSLGRAIEADYFESPSNQLTSVSLGKPTN
jgi:hypothetical protein